MPGGEGTPGCIPILCTTHLVFLLAGTCWFVAEKDYFERNPPQSFNHAALKCDLRDDRSVKERLQRYGMHPVQYEEGLAVARRVRASRYLGTSFSPSAIHPPPPNPSIPKNVARNIIAASQKSFLKLPKYHSALVQRGRVMVHVLSCNFYTYLISQFSSPFFYVHVFAIKHFAFLSFILFHVYTLFSARLTSWLLCSWVLNQQSAHNYKHQHTKQNKKIHCDILRDVRVQMMPFSKIRSLSVKFVLAPYSE